ncbi:MAG: glycosyltransferase family 2 protein [Solobacterium sp.]|nr:glycosyltransferase family 2 protein [Solobacterium sp.]
MAAGALKQKAELIRKALYVFAVQYRFHIPMRVLRIHARKFMHERQNIRTYGARFFDPEDPASYQKWLSFQTYRKAEGSVDLTYLCADRTDVMDTSGIETEYTCFTRSDTVLYEQFGAYAELCRDADVLYFDSDMIAGNGERHSPCLRTDFAYDTLRAYNCIGSVWIVRTELLKQFDGMPSDPYRFLLELSDQDLRFVHIEKILYGETRQAEDGRQSLEAYLQAHAVNASVEDRNGACKVTYALKGSPLVTVMIPTRDQKDVLERCISSVLEKTKYKNYEILILDNGSSRQETLDYFSALQKKHGNIRVIRINEPFNFSRLNNIGAEHARGEYLVLLNNDMEVIRETWMEEMLAHAQMPWAGCIGACLYYPDGTYQHAGVISGKGGAAAHRYYHAPSDQKGYMHVLEIPDNVAAVTAACLMVNREKYLSVNGMDEALTVNYNDYDLCMRILKKGYFNLFVPDAKLYHYESVSRGIDRSKESVSRYMKEIALIQERWQEELLHDPFYSDSFDKNYDYRLIAGTGSN